MMASNAQTKRQKQKWQQQYLQIAKIFNFKENHHHTNVCSNVRLARQNGSRRSRFRLAGVLLQIFILLGWKEFVQTEGNVGCHFVRTLCLEGREVCFDDNVFGKCIPTTGVDAEQTEKAPLTEDQSRLLADMLEELQGDGLGWDHAYVQCRIQGALFSLQRQTQLPPNLCGNLVAVTSNISPANSVPIKLKLFGTADDEELNNSFFYYPLLKRQTNNDIKKIFQQPPLQQRRLRHDPLELEHFGEQNMNFATPNLMKTFLETEHQQRLRDELEEEKKRNKQNRAKLYQILAASEPDPQPYQRKQTTAMQLLEKIVQKNYGSKSVVRDNQDSTADLSELYYLDNFASFKRSPIRMPHDAVLQKLSLYRESQGEPMLQGYHIDDQISSSSNEPLIETNKPHTFDLSQWRKMDSKVTLGDNLMRTSFTPFNQNDELESNMYPKNHKPEKLGRIFTEGGLVYIPENEIKTDDAGVIKQSLLANMLGFARHERLDVKKPGPLLGPPVQIETNKFKISKSTKSVGNKEILPTQMKDNDNVEANKKKKLIGNHSDEDHAPHSVDPEYAHVFVKNPIDSWSDGVRIMTELANILHMQGYFTYLTVQPHEVSFRVDSRNPDHKNAADIARIINGNKGVKNNILRRLGVTVLHAGVGDKIKAGQAGEVSSSRIELDEQGSDVTHILAYMFAGAGAAAIVVIFITLILIRRHDTKRDKLSGLKPRNDGVRSCSNDYQDLCRARMAGKVNSDPVASGCIVSFSKENDKPKPPSSRSSTSSWSEEPALTNMDISTGHMVLSYMEDHLRNKGRLQREWEALCRYEAEPSARESAIQPQCTTLNRSDAPLPYDHSRVVLNHLANAEGLDYINASTITDHDPRTPAYVAAQGPLPSTLAHFWQMIWEQGTVVIVSLCRLQENGEVACARYWPEEGAEVYHIYEVHLVSEHIWCDDYLVRSFYLKNLRTSETRTVTQFHFLSWPQGGVPSQAKALLDFRRKVNKSYRGRSCPIVVHGSKGAGRTGAYILLDLVLGRMNKGAREIDIAATLEHLRDQRSGLVATRQQFEFVLMAVAEEVHAILKALPANQTSEKREFDKDITITKDQSVSVLKEEDTAEELTNSFKLEQLEEINTEIEKVALKSTSRNSKGK